MSLRLAALEDHCTKACLQRSSGVTPANPPAVLVSYHAPGPRKVPSHGNVSLGPAVRTDGLPRLAVRESVHATFDAPSRSPGIKRATPAEAKARTTHGRAGWEAYILIIVPPQKALARSPAGGWVAASRTSRVQGAEGCLLSRTPTSWRGPYPSRPDGETMLHGR